MLNRSMASGIAGALFVLAAGSLPASAQTACAPGCDGPSNWSGFWLGAGIGANVDLYDQNTVDWRSDGIADPNAIPLARPANATVNWQENYSGRGAAGFVGSVGLGYDWQIRERLVLGAFTDFDFGRVKHSYHGIGPDANPSSSSTYSFKQNNTWNIGMRLGLVTTNTSMLYGLIGYSRTSVDFSIDDNNLAAPERSFHYSKNVDYNGLLLGIGLEHELGNGFSIKGEYRYINYGSENFLNGDVANIKDPNNTIWEVDNFDPDVHAVRLTLAYKFQRDEVEEVSYKDMPPAAEAPYK